MAHTVTVSLDDEAKKLFDQIPRGTRSRFIRDAMVDAEMISTQSGLIEALNRKIDHMKKKLFGRTVGSGETLPGSSEKKSSSRS